MKFMSIVMVLLLTLILIPDHHARQENFSNPAGPFLGQKPPGNMPELFAPGIISGPYDERIIFFAPGGRELYFQLRGAPHTVILHMKEENGVWTRPETAFFSGKYFCEFSLSPDGNRIVFCSCQPLSGKGPPTDQWRTWFVERSDSGWGKPYAVGISSGYPTLSLRNNLYFFEYREDGDHDGQIYVSEYLNGEYSSPVDIGDSDNEVNTTFHEVDPFIAPDESYLIFCSNRPGGFGDADLYICFHKKDGSWTKAMNMGKTINTEVTEFCPSVTSDGEYLFFSSNRSLFPNYSQKPLTYDEKIRFLNSAGNGSNDIYWVDARIIAECRDRQPDMHLNDLKEER